MMTNLKTTFILLSAAIFILSCSADEDKLRKDTANSFATAFFNWEYKKCLNKVTPESHGIIRFLASNVSKDEVEKLKAMPEGAAAELLPESKLLNDSTFQAVVKVTNTYCPDSIGRQAIYHNQAKAEFLLVKRNGKWRVDMLRGAPKMAFPQQSGTQGRAQNQD